MSIINLSPYRQYLYSPISYIHQIQTKYKISFVLLYLLSILYKPYISLIILSISFIMYFRQFKQLYKYNNKFVPISFMYLITFIILFLSSKQILLKNYKYTKVCYPYFFIHNPWLIITFQLYWIPNILIKTFFFLCNIISLLHIIFCTTQFEHIILTLLSIINYCFKNQNLFQMLFVSSCFLSSQLLCITMNKFKNKIISLKIRKINKLNHKYIIYVYYFIFYINQVIDNIKNIAYVLYSKEITYTFLYLKSISY